MTSSGLSLAQWIGFETLRWWQAGALFAALALPIIFLAIRSLAGLGPVRRWVALGVRLAVVLVLVLLIAGLQLRQRNHNVEVMVLWDVSDSTNLKADHSGSTLQEAIGSYLQAAANGKDKRPDDMIGTIRFNDRALIDALPNRYFSLANQANLEVGGKTDIAGAIQLGLSSFHANTLRRLLLICDGNQTTGGNLSAAVAAAASQGIPIDVMTLKYAVDNDVMVDRVGSAKQWRRENESFVLDVVLKNTNLAEVSGKLTVLHNGQSLVERSATIPAASRRADGRIEPKVKVEQIPVPELRSSGIHEFTAIFSGANVTASVGGQTTPPDKLRDNNSGRTFVMVRGKGRVLFVSNVAGEKADYLLRALRSGGIDVEARPLDALPEDPLRLQGYDAVVLNNVPKSALTGSNQDESLATYVHDMGGGLVMVGGPDAFGAGGWNSSKTKEVLPVDMDVPAQRQMPKGALVMIMHSCEMRNGNHWGEQCALKAAEALSWQDEVGVVSLGGGGANGAGWDFPLQVKGNGAAVFAAIKQMAVGDMPDFESCMQLALNGAGPNQPALIRSNAARKHVIIISDGDPSPPSAKTIAQYKAANVTVSTVPVYPHGGPQTIPDTMRKIAEETGGTAYPPIDSNPNQLPRIFIKEAITVRRTLLQTDPDGFPTQKIQTTDPVMGIAGFPPVFGFVLTTRKNDPKVEMPVVVISKDRQGKDTSDPLVAHWQTGLGRAAVVTSDDGHDWSSKWAAGPDYAKFWTQLVRTVQRPPMSQDLDIDVTRKGEKGVVKVEAIKQDGKFQSFMEIEGVVNGPEGFDQKIRLVQKRPGEYTAEFEARESGNYVVTLNYKGQKSADSGWLMSGLTVSESPEFRTLQSNDALMRRIAAETGGRELMPFDPAQAGLFSREGLKTDWSPRDIRNWLLPVLIALLIVDVAVRRIAWDWASVQRMAVAVGDYVRAWTLSRKVESGVTLEVLKRKRDEVVETKLKGEPAAPPPSIPLADSKAKFEAGAGVDGDITAVVGGATDKPLPPAPKKVEPKGGSAAGGGHTGSLLEAKRRAQQAIREREGKQ